jgi:hypothetical protein
MCSFFFYKLQDWGHIASTGKVILLVLNSYHEKYKKLNVKPDIMDCSLTKDSF